MGIIKKKRMERQKEATDSEMVHIEDPKDNGQLILVKKEDLNEQGFLIEEDIDGDSGDTGS
tara:strand:+ start:1310 stop:1492 length:183 start_codon:yes stop_codon:yes gene_type:complete